MKLKYNIILIIILATAAFYLIVTGTGAKSQELGGKLPKNLKMSLKDLISSPMVTWDERLKLSLKDLAVVTFSSLNHIGEAIRSCDTFQQHPQLKNVTFIMYLHEDVPNEVRLLYSKLCPVAKIFTLNLSKYPSYVGDLSQYRFKSIYQAMALQKHKIVLNIDVSVRFVKDANFEDLIKTAINRNPTDVTLLSSTYHNVFGSTHPGMFKFFPNVEPEKTIELIEFQSGLILWINTKNAWKTMKKFVECSLIKDCMAPIGASVLCNGSGINEHSNKFSGCHRFDQSAINLILFEASGNLPDTFQWQYPGLIVDRSENL